MKKIFIFTILFLFALSTTNTFALTPTPTTDENSLQAQVDQLKTKIASRVAQLNLVEKRGIIGTVTDSSDTQITLTDLKGNTRFIDVDELTKFTSSDSKFGISDIKTGMQIGVLGLYNKQSKRILARVIEVETPFPKIIFGAVSNIDKTNFELTIVKLNDQKTVAEVQDVTKTYSYAGGNLTKSGFSKLTIGETVIAIGLPDKQDPNKILVTRLLIFPQVDLSSKINIEEANPTNPPSTGSGLKLYPITK